MDSSCKKRKIEKKKVNVNLTYQTESFIQSFKECFVGKDVKTLENGAQVIKDPFTCCILPNFLEDQTFVDALKEGVLDLTFHEKNNDLYKFHQSDDLKDCEIPYVSEFRDLLYGEFLKWLQTVTGITLNNTIDMSSSRYDFTDVLLCHDDKLEGRRIAYIYYLVSPTWKKLDGGTLDLFNTTNDQPDEIVHSLVPKLNNFVFFEVTPYSFHQVSEILAQDKYRVSISGWFHGPSPNYKTKLVPEIKYLLHEPGFIEEELIRAWINPQYLKEDTQIEIQQKFEEDSEIQLVDFLREDRYKSISECLRNSELTWSRKGPANRKKTYELDSADPELPSIIKACLDLFKSEAMFLILSNLTGLNLHSLVRAKKGELEEEGTEKARCECSIRKWEHGCYSLIKDQAEGEETDALDVTLYFNVSDWQIRYGGYTSYIAKGEDEELLTVTPECNTLALVYRDKDTLKFVKHINSEVLQVDNNKPVFEDIHLVYYE